MVLSWVGCSASRLVALVSVRAGGAGVGNPFVEVEVRRPGGKGEGIGYMIQAAAGLTKYSFWDASKGVEVQLNIPLTPVNGKVVRGLSAKFHIVQIPCHTGELTG